MYANFPRAQPGHHQRQKVKIKVRKRETGRTPDTSNIQQKPLKTCT